MLLPLVLGLYSDILILYYSIFKLISFLVDNYKDRINGKESYL